MVPLLLVVPREPATKRSVVVMVAQGGKAAFLKNRAEAIRQLIEVNVAVCLVDVRGTGEARPGDGSPGRQGERTSIAQTELMLGHPLLGAQLRDVRAAIRWVRSRPEVNGGPVAVWGDSFAEPNPPDEASARPLDAPGLPRHAEPAAATLALLAALFEPEAVRAVSTRGGLNGPGAVLGSPYVYVPHDALVPGAAAIGGAEAVRASLAQPHLSTAEVDGTNKARGPRVAPGDIAGWVIRQLAQK